MTGIFEWLNIVSDGYGMYRCAEAADEITRLRAALNEEKKDG